MSSRWLVGVAVVLLAASSATAQPEPPPPPDAPTPAPVDAPPPPVVDAPTPPPPPVVDAPPPPPPALVVAPPPPVGAPAPPRERPTPPFLPAPGRRSWFGVEVGFVRAADSRNLYGDGPGRTVVLGIRGWETRLYERYDLEQRDSMATMPATTMAGRLSITSFGRRLSFGTNLVKLRALIGAAWLRRPSLRLDFDDISSSYEYRQQHGLGAMLGAGIQLGPLVADLRAYPTLWSDITGDSRYISVDGQPTTEAITESPGGMPVSLNVGIGVSF